MTYRIFISHKVERDKDLANLFSDKLRILSQKKIEVMVCEETPGGRDWQHWISHNVRTCNMLLYLHTSAEQDMSWCWYEAGVFDGAQSTSENLICIKHQALNNPPHLQRYQSYDATKEGLKRFFIETLYDGTFSKGEKFNEELLKKDQNELEQAIVSIIEKFEERQAITDYFSKRLEIGPILLDAPDAAQALKEAPLKFNELTRDLLQLPNIGLTWKDVFNEFDERKNAWVRDLERCAEAIQEKKYPKQVMTPFESINGRICYPVLGRVERIRNHPVKLVIAFVEGVPSQPKDEHATGLARAPEPLSSIVALLNMARRFRWNVLSPFQSKLIAQPEDDALKEVLRELDAAIERLMREAKENYFLEPQRVIALFGYESSDKVNDLYQTFYEIYSDLRKGMDQSDRGLVLKCLVQLQALNKDFLLMTIDKYRSFVEENLEPIKKAKEANDNNSESAVRALR